MRRGAIKLPRKGWRMPKAAPDGRPILNVALYPYAPRPAQFESVLTNAWRRLYPDVGLNYVDYDCYHRDPPDDLDVFVLDTIYLSYFVAQGYLLPLGISQIDKWMDFMGYALAGCRVNGTYYGIPYLGCANMLFYRDGDARLAQADGLSEVYGVLGNNPAPENPQPPQGQGLLVDFTGATTDACLYLQTVMEINDQYPTDPYLPAPDSLDRPAIGNLQLMTLMAGVAQASYGDPGDQRITWFTQGYGRAMINVTETLCSLPYSMVNDYRFHVMPLAAQRISQPFFVDGVGINSKIDPSKRDLAVALANLMTGYDVMYNSMIPDRPGDNPQYLIPVRGSVFADLIDIAPLYREIADAVLSHVDQSFRIGTGSRTWIDDVGGVIRRAILNISDEWKFTDEMFDDTEPLPADKSKPVNLFRRK